MALTEQLEAFADYRFQTDWRYYDGTLSLAELESQPAAAGTPVRFLQTKLEGRPYGQFDPRRENYLFPESGSGV